MRADSSKTSSGKKIDLHQVLKEFLVICCCLASTAVFAQPSELPSVYNPLDPQVYSGPHNLESAELLMNGYLKVSHKLATDVPYAQDAIDWNVEATDSPNTFSLYLHTLRPIFYLSDAYLRTGEQRYLDLASKFVTSHRDYALSKSKEKPNTYLWYDHSVAERTEYLISYCIALEKAGRDSESVKNYLRRHVAWLAEKKNYTERHNHGIYQDGALLKAALYLKDEASFNIAKERLGQQLEYAFPQKFIHIENSTAYHIGIVGFLHNLAEILLEGSPEYSKTVSEYVDGATDYLTYIFKPNRQMPAIGDTLGSPPRAVYLLSDTYGDPRLEYVNSMGKKGNKPDHLVRVYKKDGVVVYREHWNPEEYEQATWLTFKAGFQSSTHKHRDDLSVLLYSKGHDIFIDPGMTNYMVGSRDYDYLNSPNSHSTIFPEDKDYSVAMYSAPKTGFRGHFSAEKLEEFVGFNNAFSGVEIDRKVSVLDANTFLLVDDVLSQEERIFRQQFHLSREILTTSLEKTRFVGSIGDSGYSVVIDQLNNAMDAAIETGDDEPGKLSVRSVGLNKSQSSSTLVFRKRGKKTQLITLIRIVKSQAIEQLAPAHYKDQTGMVELGDRKVSTSTYRKPTSWDLNIFMRSGILNIEKLAENYEVVQAYELLHPKDGRTLQSSIFSANRLTRFRPVKNHAYVLKASFKRPDGGTDVRILGKLEVDGDSHKFVEYPAEYQTPHVDVGSIEEIGENKFLFNLDIQGEQAMISAGWYIYRNGASFDYKISQSSLEYVFDKPGRYTIINRVNHRYFGEIYKGNFPEVIVE